ncbi:hypothetical protein K8P10_002422 [Leucobacter sp. Psy1]|uniref:DUF1648 domain-containing protein n=1 Tax=Leucobacter sp. Psy1 TaxID=2875729 RepID=UPI001CD1A81A|nr:DUF1648 domain-containing protein [Leucobacter sp. Psy1]UBH06911.1 hypothetical protein K8P10_002422 [Leucobacter sp. Psy1]
MRRSRGVRRGIARGIAARPCGRSWAESSCSAELTLRDRQLEIDDQLCNGAPRVERVIDLEPIVDAAIRASAGGSAASGKMDRPARTYVTGKWTRGLRISALGVAGISAASILIGYASLPETIPTHFDFAGRPDGWGHKSSVLVILGILGAMTAGIVWLSHHPRVFNYPVPITEFNAQAVYRVGEQTMVWVSLGCALLLAGASTSMVMAIGLRPVLGGCRPWFQQTPS